MSFYAWGLTELTVNSCFFDTPPRAYLNYNIYILIFICVWGEPCIFGVLTVNLLTPILIFSFQSASFYLGKRLILRRRSALY